MVSPYERISVEFCVRVTDVSCYLWDVPARCYLAIDIVADNIPHRLKWVQKNAGQV